MQRRNHHKRHIIKRKEEVNNRVSFFSKLLYNIGSVIDVSGSQSDFSRFRKPYPGIDQYWKKAAGYFLAAIKKV